MQKHRVLLILISLILIIALYFLPRIVVDNEKDMQIGAEKPEEAVAGDDGDGNNDIMNLHSAEIPDEDQSRIDELRREMDAEEEQKLVLADSLANLFSSYNQYDSAAKYYDIIATEHPGKDEYERAGNAYYDAFGFAMERDIANLYSEKARYYFDLVLKEDPSRLDIKNKLAMAYISSPNPMQGITMLREIILEDPENEEALFNLGILAVQSGQYERGRERFKNLVSLYPQNLQAQFYLALCYYELGEKEDAIRQFELVRSMEDDPAVLATIEGYLKELN